MHALVATRLSSTPLTVHLVLTRRRHPEIQPSIVPSVTAPMVHHAIIRYIQNQTRQLFHPIAHTPTPVARFRRRIPDRRITSLMEDRRSHHPPVEVSETLE